MTLIIRRPWTQQPQQVGAASGDALSAGLLTLNNFSASRAATYGSQTFSLAGSGHIMRPTSAGIGLSGAGAGRLQGSNLTVVGDVSSSSFAVFLHFALNATGQTNKYAIYQKHSTGSQQAALIYGYVANSFEFYSDGYGGTDPRTGSQIVVTDTRPHALLYTLSNGVWAGYLDGQRVFSTSRSFSLPSTSVSSAWLLDIDTPAATLNATLLSHATFGRGLPDGLAREFTARPGLLFAPQRIWVPVSAGGGSSWTVTLTDAASATDAFTPSLDALRALTDTASATDSLTAAVDAVVALLDAASASDLLTAAAVVQAVISDLAGASDTSTAAVDATVALTDAASATDTATGSFEAAGTVALSDLASANDSLTCAATLLVTLADSASGTDAYTAAAELVRTLTDTASATDTITASIPGSWDVTLTDLAAAVDVIAAVIAGADPAVAARYTITARARRLVIEARARRLEAVK